MSFALAFGNKIIDYNIIRVTRQKREKKVPQLVPVIQTIQNQIQFVVLPTKNCFEFQSQFCYYFLNQFFVVEIEQSLMRQFFSVLF